MVASEGASIASASCILEGWCGGDTYLKRPASGSGDDLLPRRGQDMVSPVAALPIVHQLTPLAQPTYLWDLQPTLRVQSWLSGKFDSGNEAD